MTSSKQASRQLSSAVLSCILLQHMASFATTPTSVQSHVHRCAAVLLSRTLQVCSMPLYPLVMPSSHAPDLTPAHTPCCLAVQNYANKEDENGGCLLYLHVQPVQPAATLWQWGGGA
jgi:hypothetical protein